MSAAAQHTEEPGVAGGLNGDQEYSFRFVEVGEPTQDRDEDARSVIRSHVMRDYYGKRDRRKQPGTLPIINPVVTREAGPPQTQRFKVGPQGLQEVKKRRKKINKGHGKLPSVATGSVATIETAIVSHPSKPTLSGPASARLTASSSRKAASNARDEQPPNKETSPSPHAVLQPGSHLPGAQLIDPFDVLPPSVSPQTQRLLYYANRGILSSRLMGQLRTEWLSLAIQDTALFHVALSHYAGNYGLARRENDPVEALRFRMEAMRIVNERLENMESALTDGTLGTVASLSSYEATNGTLAAIETHMKGLQRLVNLRGGLMQHNINPHTRRLVLWADLNCANALGVFPAFPILESGKSTNAVSWLDAVAEAENQFPSVALYGDSTLSSGSLQSMTKELKDNFTILKYFSNLGPLDRANNKEEKERQIQDSDKLYFTERSLLNLSNCWGPTKFATSACLATIIFIDNHLRGIRFHARIMDRLVARLQFSMNMVLSDINRHSAKKDSVKAMFWVLFVGGIAAGLRPERNWFASYLSNFVDELNLQDWEEAELVLSTFLWPKAWQAQGNSLWEQLRKERVTSGLPLPQSFDMEPLGNDYWSLLDGDNQFADSEQ